VMGESVSYGDVAGASRRAVAIGPVLAATVERLQHE
jgi:hypothetical protein